MTLFTEIVILRRRGTVTGADDYGNDVYGPDTDTESPAWYEPRASGEDTAAREQVVSGYWLYLPAAAPLSAADVVVIGGVEYEVDGDPGLHPGGFTLDGFQVAAVRRVTG